MVSVLCRGVFISCLISLLSSPAWSATAGRYEFRFDATLIEEVHYSVIPCFEEAIAYRYNCDPDDDDGFRRVDIRDPEIIAEAGFDAWFTFLSFGQTVSGSLVLDWDPIYDIRSASFSETPATQFTTCSIGPASCRFSGYHNYFEITGSGKGDFAAGFSTVDPSYRSTSFSLSPSGGIFHFSDDSYSVSLAGFGYDARLQLTNVELIDAPFLATPTPWSSALLITSLFGMSMFRRRQNSPRWPALGSSK